MGTAAYLRRARMRYNATQQARHALSARGAMITLNYARAATNAAFIKSVCNYDGQAAHDQVGRLALQQQCPELRAHRSPVTLARLVSSTSICSNTITHSTPWNV
eukprot:TRINITY_DN4248_c0_g1_i1.p2 TRINITY_DN4248_c0_g1~~TRINITY_DN4248_c0_g1_i1.p2  ORF type:complete len:104 (+),score=5.95 TRINITY_DN4248_c0_g1_i1:101-412(+)